MTSSSGRFVCLAALLSFPPYRNCPFGGLCFTVDGESEAVIGGTMIPEEPGNERPGRPDVKDDLKASEPTPKAGTGSDRLAERGPREHPSKLRVTVPPHAAEAALQASKAFRSGGLQQAIANAQSLAGATHLQTADLGRLMSIADSPALRATMQSAGDSIAKMSLPHLDETMRKLSESMAPLLDAQQAAFQSLAKQVAGNMSVQMAPFVESMRSMAATSPVRMNLGSLVEAVNVTLGAIGFRSYGPMIPVPSYRVVEIADQNTDAGKMAVEVDESAKREAEEIVAQVLFAVYTICVLASIFTAMEGFAYSGAFLIVPALMEIYERMKKAFPDVFGGDDYK